MPRVKIAQQLMDAGGGLGAEPKEKMINPFAPPPLQKGTGWGNVWKGLNKEAIESIKSWVKFQLGPIKQRADKVETEITALHEAIKKLEKGLKSTDMKSQMILDKVDALALDVLKKNDLLKNNINDAVKNLSELKKSVEANASGIVSVSNTIEVKAEETLRTSAGMVQRLQTQLRKRIDQCEVKNNELSADLASLTVEVKKWPAIHQAFKNEYGSFVKRVNERHKDFTNDLDVVKKDVGVAVNRLNTISADFSNHVGDFKSHVASFDKSVADFNTYRNKHKQVHSKQDADFANEKLRLNNHIADFKEHTVDYTRHKVPKNVQKERMRKRLEQRVGKQAFAFGVNQYGKGEKKEGLVKKLLSMFKKKDKSESTKTEEVKVEKKPSLGLKSPGLGALPYKWYGGNQYVNTTTTNRTWRGGNQYQDSTTRAKSRYKSRGRGIKGRA